VGQVFIYWFKLGAVVWCGVGKKGVRRSLVRFVVGG
jgi:hypothetical protein